jgi:DNA invertase Pin-like site-specific DNA recombinase
MKKTIVENKMPCAVIYTRVSTDEQASQQHNLPAQERKCVDYCSRNSLEPLKVFTDAESGRTDDRPKFQAMIRFCHQHRTRITHVVVADLSRFARSVLDQAKALETFANLNIKLCSVDEAHIDGTAAGKLASNIHGAFNQFFSDSLSERTKFRMAEAVRAGRFPWPAPIGYLNTGGGQLKVDSDRAPMVRRAFELVSQGSHATDAIRRTLGALGLRTRRGQEIPRQTFLSMLWNELYAGWVCGAGIRVAGKHESIISEKLFADVQRVLDGKANGIAIPHPKGNPDFPLRGFVRCGTCGRGLTAGHATGRNKVEHARYWCWNAACPSKVGVSKAQLETDWVRLLAVHQPTDEYLAESGKIAMRAWEQRQARMAEDSRALTMRLQEQTTLNQKLILAKLKGEISQSDFDAVKPGIDKEIVDIEAAKDALEMETSTMSGLIEAMRFKLANLVDTWREGGISDRCELQNAMFPDGLPYSPKNGFFEPFKSPLINEMVGMLDELCQVGVPDGI